MMIGGEVAVVKRLDPLFKRLAPGREIRLRYAYFITCTGVVKNEKGEPWTGVSNGKPWKGAFDVDIFVDDDNKPYLYFPGRSTDGIYVAPLDPDDSDSRLSS